MVVNNELPPPDKTREELRLIKPFGPDDEPIISPTLEELAVIETWGSTYQPKEEEISPEL
ncbi:MAG TPA: hypothetical protein PJ984_02075 [Candidatus Saccharibacteria bacterium]|jgi:hypothetical protein|nr:hypothetical protein [Patescibacteria group bacterium]HMS31162.1 hypothetical protein [Candidatus Saccharibacteria bacterium]